MIHFTKHALEKFEILKQHGFVVSKNDVERTIIKPDVIDNSRYPLKIAQRVFDKTHVLRVVYREVNGTRIIITFYPGRRIQYEK